MSELKPTPAKQSASSPASVWRKLTIGLGMIAVLASFWAAALVALLAGRQFAVITHLDGYRPAEFTVENLVYLQGRYYGTKSSSPTIYFAEGTVDGRQEKFELGAYLPKIPASKAELESMMQVGRVLPVLYNPEVPDTIGVRVLYPDKDFPDKWLLSRNNLVKYGFAPMGIALALCLLCSFIERSWLGWVSSSPQVAFRFPSWA